MSNLWSYMSIESTSGNALAFRKTGLEDRTFTWLDKDFDDNYHVIGNEG